MVCSKLQNPQLVKENSHVFELVRKKAPKTHQCSQKTWYSKSPLRRAVPLFKYWRKNFSPNFFTETSNEGYFLCYPDKKVAKEQNLGVWRLPRTTAATERTKLRQNLQFRRPYPNACMQGSEPPRSVGIITSVGVVTLLLIARSAAVSSSLREHCTSVAWWSHTAQHVNVSNCCHCTAWYTRTLRGDTSDARYRRGCTGGSAVSERSRSAQQLTGRSPRACARNSVRAPAPPRQPRATSNPLFTDGRPVSGRANTAPRSLENLMPFLCPVSDAIRLPSSSSFDKYLFGIG